VLGLGWGLGEKKLRRGNGGEVWSLFAVFLNLKYFKHSDYSLLLCTGERMI